MAIPGLLPFEKRTVTDSIGRGDLGRITEEIASAISCKAGVIRLLNGVEGRAGGFGLAHLNHHTSRMKQIIGLGYRDAFVYVQFIARGFERIAKQENERLVLLREANNMHHRLVCQWDDDLAIWSVTTAIPKVGIRDLTICWPA